MDVSIEVGPKRRAFASACLWPGLTRSGKSPEQALDALLAACPRYRSAVSRGGIEPDLPVDPAELVIVERLDGGAVTDYGAISRPLRIDTEPLDDAEVERLAQILVATWRAFDLAFQRVPPESRPVKPSHGRSPDEVRRHVAESDRLHLAAFGVPHREPSPDGLAEFELENRSLFRERLEASPRGAVATISRRYGFDWTPRFAVRRSAWHALDHAWELEDRPG
jgi:hypothetical protein